MLARRSDPPLAGARDARILLAATGHVVAEIACARCPLVVGLWRRSFSLADVLELRRVLLDARRGATFAMLTALDTGAMDLRALEDERVRTGLVELARDLAPRTAASAIVVEGGGFKSAAMRTASAGVTLVARPPFPTRTFADVASAVAWLAPHLGARGAGVVDAVLASVDLVRARLAWA